MTPFAIAGTQMHISAQHSNVEAMVNRIDLTVAQFPWMQMIVFSKLAPHGPLSRFATALPSENKDKSRAAAEKHGT